MHGFHELEKCVIYLCRCGVGWGGVVALSVFSLQLSPLFLRLSLEPLVLTVGMGDRAELSCCVLCRCCDVLSRI